MLKAVAGWHTARVQRPVLILGQLDGVLTGIRQLRRTRPLETEEIGGLRVPTLAEMARIKAWLVATRNTVRDYLDTVVLFERLGEEGLVSAMRPFDEIYRQPSAASPLAEVAEHLASAAPADRAAIDLGRYRALQPPWSDWGHVVARGRHWAAVLARVVLEGTGRERGLHARARSGTATRSTCAAIGAGPAPRPWRGGRVARPLPHGAGRRGTTCPDSPIVLTVPVTMPHFWLAALGSLGHAVDFGAPVPDYYEATAV